MLSVLDGRYSKKVDSLRNYGTEDALIMKRIEIEIEYLKLLSDIIPELKDVHKLDFDSLELYIYSDPDEFQKSKNLREKRTMM